MSRQSKNRLLFFLLLWSLPFIGSANLDVFCEGTPSFKKDTFQSTAETILSKTNVSLTEAKVWMYFVLDKMKGETLNPITYPQQEADHIRFSFERTRREIKRNFDALASINSCQEAFAFSNRLFYVTSAAEAELVAFSQKLDAWLTGFVHRYESERMSEEEKIRFFIQYFSALSTIKAYKPLIKETGMARSEFKALRDNKSQFSPSDKTHQKLSEIIRQLVQGESLLNNTLQALHIAKNKTYFSLLGENTSFSKETQRAADKAIEIRTRLSKMRARLQPLLQDSSSSIPSTIEFIFQTTNQIKQEVEGQVRMLEQKYGQLKSPRYGEHSRSLAMLFYLKEVLIKRAEAKTKLLGEAQEEHLIDEFSMVFLRIEIQILNQLVEVLEGVRDKG
ncbi:MAG: hypothetical protein HY559_02175 [Gammaproteobacteria bacterium]|nr:hypothetical protein [Gammaproteobacteria bacterium]